MLFERKYFCFIIAREGYSSLYLRLSKLFPELSLAKGDGRYGKLLSGIARTNLLILDDWGLSKLNKEQQRDFLEIVEDRYEVGSTVITSQLPVNHWHEVMMIRHWQMPFWTVWFIMLTK